MKRYIAFATTSNSGIVTMEAAEKWAAKTLADRPNLQHVHIAEVLQVCERITPTVQKKAFVVHEPTPPTASDFARKCA